MAEDIHWVDAGVSAMAIASSTLKVLVLKGVITPQEHEKILDSAIAELEVNPVLKQAAENIRIIFKRP